VDILVSTGEGAAGWVRGVCMRDGGRVSGKTRELDPRTTVYMKNQEVVYQLKLKVSRAFFSDADKRFGALPFTLRSFDDEVKTKMAANECERHGLIKAFPVSCVPGLRALSPLFGRCCSRRRASWWRR